MGYVAAVIVQYSCHPGDCFEHLIESDVGGCWKCIRRSKSSTEMIR